MSGAGGKAIKSVALLGHANCGKTMLAEALLFKAGVTKRMGTIQDGNTVSDTEPEEKERQASIDSAILHFDWNGTDINLVDTPGYPDFIGQVIPTLRAVDAAIICVSAASGVEVNTRRVWELAEKEGLPRAVVISKMDGENADFDKCVADVQEAFGAQCKPFLVPRGAGAGFEGVDSVLKGEAGDKDSLMESIVETDEALLERYLEGGEVSDAELESAVSAALTQGTLSPIFCLAAEKDIGVTELADFIVKYVPGPVDRKVPVAEGGDVPGAGMFAAQVFKSVTDPFVGKVSFFRVFSGGVGSGETVVNLRTKEKSKLAQLFRVQGKEQEAVDKAAAGDIVCVAKIEDLQLADTIGSGEGNLALAAFTCPEPMVSLAVEPKKRGDEGKIGGSLDKLAQEDPTFKVTRDSRTHEMVVAGMSNLHLDIMLERLKRRFDVEVNTKEPKIPYKETVTKGAQGHYKHKKQTGGRGQYAEVYLRVVPLERGEGFKFGSEVVGGSIPTQYIPAVEKGIRETLVKGIMAGYPIEDVEAIVTDGSYHDVDSSEAAFKIAASRAFREAFMAARPCLLEPVVEMHVSAPLSHMGDITGDLNSRRGRILGIDSHGSGQTINAHVPLGEIMRYSTELRSTTGGEGSYTIEFARYDIVPAQIAEGLVKNKAQQEEEE